jgi:hypothetical protein
MTRTPALATVLLLAFGLALPPAATASAAPASPEGGPPVQSEVAVSHDATIDAIFPNTNLGDSSTLTVSQLPTPHLHRTVTLLRFQLDWSWPPIPATAVVDSAQLELFRSETGTPGRVRLGVYEVYGDWSEGTVTWATKPTWSATPVSTRDVPADEYASFWDITPMVQAWQSGANRGLVVKAVDGTTADFARAFRSSEGAYPHPTVRVNWHYPCTAIGELTYPECVALDALYATTHGENWVHNDGWWATTTPCSTPWHGVSCESGHVVKLRLNDNNLAGTLSANIGSLHWVEELWLDGNGLTGNLPAALGNLEQLVDLRLSRNQFSGAIPAALGNASSLRYLLLSGNQLTGGLPEAVGGLNFLRMHVDGNPLSGPLPRSLIASWPNSFYFHGTNLCEPRDAAFQAWMASVPDLRSTGVKCSNCTGDGVYLHEGTNYGGACWKWTDSDNSLANDENFGNLARSVKFVGAYAGGKYTAALYAFPSYTGAHTVFGADDPDLSNDAIGNDHASSLAIAPVPQCAGDGVYLFEGAGYMGRCRKFTADEPDLAEAAFAGIVSSVRLGGSYAGSKQARLCRATAYGDPCSVFTANDPDLAGDAVGDNLARSLRIEQAPSLTRRAFVLVMMK